MPDKATGNRADFRSSGSSSDRPHKLTIYFIPAKIDAILTQFGDKPWRGKRPVVVPASSAGEAIVVGTLDWREALPG
jgi:hypothetical protein